MTNPENEDSSNASFYKRRFGESKIASIGELLTLAEIISPDDLSEATDMADRVQMAVGKVLIKAGYLQEQEWMAALEAQALIEDGHISIESAAKALGLVSKKKQTLEESLTELGLRKTEPVTGTKLGSLLIDANILSQEQLDAALKESFSTGLPLGFTLVQQKSIYPSLLISVLTAQTLTREGKLSKDQAVDLLKRCHSEGIAIDELIEKETN